MLTDTDLSNLEPIEVDGATQETQNQEQVYEIVDETTEQPTETPTETTAETTAESPSKEAETEVVEEPKVKEVIKEVVKEVEKKYSNETVKQIDTYLKSNPEASVEDVMKLLTTDTASLDEEDLVIEGWKAENPNITDRLIRLKMERFDPIFLSKEEQAEQIENGKLTRKELHDLNVEFEQELIKGRTSIHDRKKAIEDVLKNAEQPQAENAQLEAYKQEVSKALEGFESLAVEVDDETKIDFKLADEEVSQVRNLMENPDTLWHRYQGETGNDYDKFKQDMTFLMNRDKILKLAYQQGLEKGKLAEIEETNNIDFDKNKKPASVKSPNIYEAYKKAMGEA